jgi:hypothetical protein
MVANACDVERLEGEIAGAGSIVMALDAILFEKCTLGCVSLGLQSSCRGLASLAGSLPINGERQKQNGCGHHEKKGFFRHRSTIFLPPEK